MAMTIGAASKYNAETLKDMSEDQLVEWAKAKKQLWEKVREAIGASAEDTLEDISEVAPEDYEDAVHDLTTKEQLKPLEVTKLFKLINAIRVSQGLDAIEFKPLSAKKARVAPAAGSDGIPIQTDPPSLVPPNDTARSTDA